MNYHEIIVSAEHLKDSALCYWEMTGFIDQEKGIDLRYIPEGQNLLIFNFGNPIELLDTPEKDSFLSSPFFIIPTIASSRLFNQKGKIDSLYNLYLKNQITLEDIQGGINEVYQIGFRLGKQLDGIDIIAVDHHGNWLAPYADFIADTLVFEDYLKHNSSYAQSMKEKNDLFLERSIRENLIYLNEREQILDNHNYYNNVAIKVKDTANIMFTYQEITEEINGLPYQMRSFDFNNVGVELVAEWYKRNLFIYRNILEKSEENDRILVIIGSGHVFYLNQLLENNLKFKITSPNEFLNEGN